MIHRHDNACLFRPGPVLAVATLLIAAAWMAVPASAQSCTSDAECDNGNACNGVETCDLMLMQCVSGTPIVCNDGDPCTLDFCIDPAGTCLFQPSADAEVAAGWDGICLTRDDNIGLLGTDGLCGTGDDLTGDGLCELVDNCDDWYNPGQADGDGDGVGDLCDQNPCSGPGLLAVAAGALKRTDAVHGEESLILYGLDSTKDVAVNGDGTLAVVTEHDIGRISVVNLASKQIVNQVMTTAPWGADFDPSGTIIYFTDRSSGEVESVSAFDCCPGSVAFGVGDARGIDVDAAGVFAYVTDYTSGTVWRVNLGTGSKVPLASGLVGPMGIVLSPDESTAYVIEKDAGTLSSIDTATGVVTPVLPGMYLVGGVELNEAGSIAYVTHTGFGFSSIGQIDLSSPALVALSIFATSGFDPGLARVSQPEPIMSLPEGASGLPPGSAVVPITIDDLTGQGVLSADIVVEFNPGVLSAASVALGPLASMCTLTDNLADPGRAVISIFCASPLAGAGTLAEITFDIVGTSGMGTPLHITSSLLNEGTPGVCPDDGGFYTPVQISGAIRYYRDSVVQVEPSTKPVDDATVYLGYDGSGSTPTTCTGSFSLGPLVPAFSFSITPFKTDDALGAVDPFDASLNAQHVVGLLSLTANQRVAADVSANGALTSFDSALMAQYSVGTITQFPAAALMGSDWVFDPVPQGEPNIWITDPFVPSGVPGSIRYLPILEDAESQDFLGILLGDVSGNWQGTCPGAAPGTGGLESAAAAGGPALLPGTRRQGLEKGAASGGSLSLPTIRAASGEVITVPLRAEGVAGAVSAYLDLRFDSSVLRLISVARGDMASQLSLTSNVKESGRARIALYGTSPLSADGDLLVAAFEVIGRPGSRSKLSLAATTVNEGQIPVEVRQGRVTVTRNGEP